MAEPILLKLPPRDPREALYHKLENAPNEHAEALLAAYDILQGLHDKGLLEIAKGALGSGDKLLEILVNAADQPEVVRGIRNLIILTKLMGALDPKLLEHVAQVVPNALAEGRTEKPLGLFGLLGKLSNQDTRRLLTIATRVMESLGKDLGSESPAK
jgi:uncharacterized protein YjgD (DUF1641 family)